MASQNQIDANRLNAQKSTGPRSDETKAKTRLNAKRDGITGQVTTLSEEDRPVFEKLKAELVADLAPKTVMELKLASSIAWDTWRLDHLRAVEMNMYALGSQEHSLSLCSPNKANPENTVDCDNPQLDTAMSGALTFVKESPRFALMSLYEQRLNRSIHKNLAILRELQAERKHNFEQDREREVAIARANDINALPYKAPARPSENGFVFSTGEILAAANRDTVLHMSKYTVATTRTSIQFAGAWDNEDPNRPNSGMRAATAA